MLGMQAVAAHWRELPPRDRTILVMRFYGDMTQAQIGQRFGLFQMHVSRLIARARAISAGVSSISRTAPSLPRPSVRK